MTSLPGRSLLAGQCTVGELAGLTKDFAIGRNYIGDKLATYAYDSVIVDGDLVIDGDLDTFDRKLCRLVVTGSLRVSGLYRDYDDPQTAVFVLGDFVADRAITSGALAVAGNVTVRDALVGYYNDHSAELHGNVTTRVFVPENHFFTIHGALHADYVLGSRAEYLVPPKLKKSALPIDDRRLRELLVPEVLEIEDYGDPSEEPEITLKQPEIRKYVAANAAILRADTSIAATAMPSETPAATEPVSASEVEQPAAAEEMPAASKPAATSKP